MSDDFKEDSKFCDNNGLVPLSVSFVKKNESKTIITWKKTAQSETLHDSEHQLKDKARAKQSSTDKHDCLVYVPICSELDLIPSTSM